MPSNAADFIADLPPNLQRRFESFCNEIVAEHQRIKSGYFDANTDPLAHPNCLIGCLGEDKSHPVILIIPPDELKSFTSKQRLSASIYVRKLKLIEEYKANPSRAVYAGLIAEAAFELLSGSDATGKISPTLTEVNRTTNRERNPRSSYTAILSLFGMLSVIGGIVGLLLDITDFGAWIALAIGVVILRRTKIA